MQNIFIELLPPWIETGLQPAFYDKESGTVLQQVSRMWAKMIQLGQAFNDFSEDTAETVNEYIAKFVELHDYVEDYFANLDVQEEINNKLDNMVEAGTLQEIITTYIQSNVAWTFDTVADMKAATNLVSGSYARTLGFHSVSDGGGAIYKLTNSGVANEMDKIAVGSLIANLINGKSVKQYGAYGDDSHDDTTVIQYVITNNKVVYIPQGTYKITDELDLVSQRHIYGDGQMSVLKSYYSSSSVKYILKAASDETSIQRTIIENLSFGNSDVDKVAGGIYIEYALRGVVLHNLWFSLSNPIKLGNKTWGIVDVSNIFSTYLPTTPSNLAIGLYAEGNTVYGDNLEFIGDFEKGIYLTTVNVVRLTNLNVSGSGDDHLMKNAITVEDTKDVVINTGWFEHVVADSDDINTKNINILNSSNVRIINTHLSVSSLYVDGSTDVKLENNRYYRASAGLRIMNGSTITCDSISLGFVNYQTRASYTNGDVTVVDIPNISGTNMIDNPLLLNGTTAPITRTNNSSVSFSSDTVNYYSGDKSNQYTTTSNNEGVRLTISSIGKVGKTYTALFVVRAISNIKNLYFDNTGINTSSDYPIISKYPKDSNWYILRYTGKMAESTCRIDLRASLEDTTQNGVFAVDSIYLFEGNHDNSIPVALDKKQFMKFNKLYTSYAPTDGTWSAGDTVYNNFASDTTTLCWVYNGSSWVTKTVA
jgi:hypothetical protein